MGTSPSLHLVVSSPMTIRFSTNPHYLSSINHKYPIKYYNNPSNQTVINKDKQNTTPFAKKSSPKIAPVKYSTNPRRIRTSPTQISSHVRALTIWIHAIYAALRNRIKYTHEQKSSKQEGDVAGTYKGRPPGCTAPPPLPRARCSPAAAARAPLLH